MESFAGDAEENSEDLTARKKSKLKTLKSRLFGKSKRGEGKEDRKLSQSASDITAAQDLGSEEDLACSPGILGSRALSHDSIFLDDQVMSDPQPARVLSQENIHSKIKDLQAKLQQQKMHLGPPPLVLPIRRVEDMGSSLEDDGPPHSPPGTSGADGTSKGVSYKLPALPRNINPSLTETGIQKNEQVSSQPSSCPLSPTPKPPPTRSMPPTPSLSNLSPVAPPASVAPSVDFNTPVQFTPCLDTSAARHRMAVKPRNQRISTKGKRLAASSLENLNDIDHPVSEQMEDQEVAATKEDTTLETKQTPPAGSIAALADTQIPAVEVTQAPIKPEVNEKRKDPGLLERLTSSLSNKDTPVSKTPVTDKIPETEPGLKEDTTSSARRLSASLASVVAFRSSSFKRSPEDGSSQGKPDISAAGAAVQQAPGQKEAGLPGAPQRPASSSFRFAISSAKNRDDERPRSGSFVGVVEQAGTKLKREGISDGKLTPSFMSQRGQEQKVGKQEEDKLKQVKPKEGPPAGTLERKELSGSREEVEEAVEAMEVEEDPGKTTFGVKLRSTSLSLKSRSDAAVAHCESKIKRLSAETSSLFPTAVSSNPSSKSMLSENLQINTSTSSATSSSLRQTDGAVNQPSFSTTSDKSDLPSSGNAQPVDDQTSSNSKKADTSTKEPQALPQPAPQAAPSDVSWMSLAMMKTRTFQALLTSKLPKEFPGMQSATQPQTQTQPPNQDENVTQTQTQKVIEADSQKATETQTHTQAEPQSDIQTLSETTKAPSMQTGSTAQTAKPTPTVSMIQQRIATQSINPLSTRSPQTSKQADNSQSQPKISQSTTQSGVTPVSSSSVQAGSVATQSPVRSFPQTRVDSTSRFVQSGSSTQQSNPQQVPKTNASLSSVTQPKPATSTQLSDLSSTASPAPALGGGEKATDLQGKGEGPSMTDRRTVWGGTVNEKAAFLQKRAEWSNASGSKVELRKSQTETAEEVPASTKAAPPNTDTSTRPGLKHPESSPAKVPGRLAEDKWTKKTVPSSSSPSSSPKLSSPLQTMSESGQPSWMELAKRKSMAWSDKNMD